MRIWGTPTLAMYICLIACASSALSENTAESPADVFEKLYGADLKKVASTPDKKDDLILADQIASAAKGLSNQPELLSLMCDKVFELASKDPAGFQTATDVLHLIIEKVPTAKSQALDRLAGMKEKELQTALPDNRLRITEELISLQIQQADAKAQSGDFAGAIQTINKAMGNAAANKSPTRDSLALKAKIFGERQKTAQDIASLQAKIKADENDVQSRNQLIVLFVTEMDDLKQAQDLITPSVNEQLKIYVPLAGKNVKDLADSVCQELGDWFYRLSSSAATTGKINAMRSAMSYFQAFLSKHSATDLARSTVELTMSKIQADLASLDPALAMQDGTLIFVETFDHINKMSQPDGWDMCKNKPDKVVVGPDKNNNVLALITKDPNQPAYCERLIPLEPEWYNLTVTARLRGKNIKVGAGYPNGAKLTLRVTDTTMRNYTWPIPALSVYGDCEWKTMSVSLDVPRGARFLRLEPSFWSGTSGELYIDDIRVYANATPISAPFLQGFGKLDDFGIPVGWIADPGRVKFMKEGDKSFIRLEKKPNDPQISAITYVKVDPKWQAVRITAQARCSNFPPAVDYYWTSGLILLVPEYAECVLAGDFPHSPPFKKDTNWTEFKYQFNIPKDTYRFKIEVRTDVTPGVFDVADIKIEQIDKIPPRQ